MHKALHKIPLIFSSVLIFYCCSANSANVKFAYNTFWNPVILISGVIEKGDYERVMLKSKEYAKTYLPNETGLTFSLDSTGGDVNEAMKIGRFFRESLASVEVIGRKLLYEESDDAEFIISYLNENPHFKKTRYTNTKIFDSVSDVDNKDMVKCYSACVLMFYGGVTKFTSDNAIKYSFKSPHNQTIPVIGLHRPYYDKSIFKNFSAAEAKKKYGILEQLTIDYLVEMGAYQEVIIQMFKTSSNDIDLVDNDDFKKLYNNKEPFFDEWLLAKCDQYISKKPKLSEAELDEYKKLDSIAMANEEIELGLGEGLKVDFDTDRYNQLRVKLFRDSDFVVCEKNIKQIFQKEFLLSQP